MTLRQKRITKKVVIYIVLVIMTIASLFPIFFCLSASLRTQEDLFRGPLMLVRGVENVHFDELGEIELASGETRRCRVLEINGSDALVQLFESSTGINLSDSKVRFLGRSMELGVSEDMLGRVFDGMGRPIDDGPEILPRGSVGKNGDGDSLPCGTSVSLCSAWRKDRTHCTAQPDKRPCI